jgi:hypothetical protein
MGYGIKVGRIPPWSAHFVSSRSTRFTPGPWPPFGGNQGRPQRVVPTGAKSVGLARCGRPTSAAIAARPIGRFCFLKVHTFHAKPLAAIRREPGTTAASRPYRGRPYQALFPAH